MIIWEVVPGVMGGPQEGPGRGRRGHERFELTFSDRLGPPDALSLRFPLFLTPRALSLGACAGKSPRGELSPTPDFWFFKASRLGGEPLKEGYSALGNRR